MWNFIVELIQRLRRSLKGRGISILTLPSNDNKTVQAVAYNADRGFWRHLRKALAKAGFNDGYGAVVILQLFAMIFVKRTLRATYRAKASCNDGDVFAFEKGQKLAKARVRAKMLRGQYLYISELVGKLATLTEAVDQRFLELDELDSLTEENLWDIVDELHEPQGE